MGGGNRAASPIGTARNFTPAPCLDLGLQDYYQDRPLGLVEEPGPRLLLGYHSPQDVIDRQVWAEAGSFLGVGLRNRIEHCQTHGAPHLHNYSNPPSLHSHHQWRATAGVYLAQRMSQSRSQQRRDVSRCTCSASPRLGSPSLSNTSYASGQDQGSGGGDPQLRRPPPAPGDCS
ncbi:hypothetical protein Pcinc_005885 [Petrolisthes cinctipes]|uniref:Uncharacterized protein n=1 Tax=Petrolisthes cinctipes TaxID=88211 RepID=A0AAE1KZN9_PETCI|nr:hypothetical protein Pcinc_005885 [Petrolisthes cinctipes]